MPTSSLLFATYAAVAFGTACAIFCLGKIAAQRVWSRVSKKMDEDPHSQEVLVPSANSIEAILIFTAVMLRSPFMLMLSIYRESRLQEWEKSSSFRKLDLFNPTRKDLLGSVSHMLSGYPERATPFYLEQQIRARHRAYLPLLEELKAHHESQSANQTANG